MSIMGAAAVPHPPIILPEVGHGEEQKIAATTAAYEEVARRIVELEPETIVITSPHSVMYADYFHISPGESSAGNLSQFRAPQVAIAVRYDVEFVNKLIAAAMSEDIPAGTLGERNSSLDHGTLIPLYFLQKAGLDFGRVRFIRIGLSGLTNAMHYKLGQTIAKTAQTLNRRVFFIASGDLAHKLKGSHYGFAAEAPVFDEQVMNNLGSGDFLKLLTMDERVCSRAAECGLRSFWIMAGALDKLNVQAERLSYEGTFGVGYGVVYFGVDGEDSTRNFSHQLARVKRDAAEARKAKEDDFVKLARYSLETFVKTHKPATLPTDLPAELTGRRAGAFVSLHKDGNLRGCIGTIMATQVSLAEEILQNAISACSRDPRFDPVKEDELDDLEYSVDVLGEPERVFDVKALDVKRYGVIVENGNRRGLLLPDLEGVDTVEEQIAIAKRKAGIRPDEKVLLWRFEVVRHH